MEEDDSAPEYVMSWVSTLSNQFHFGPKPSNMRDLNFLRSKKNIGIIINTLPREANFTKVQYSMKKAVNMCESYTGLYEAGEFPFTYIHVDFDPAEIVAKGRLKEEQQQSVATAYADYARKILKCISSCENKHCAVYIHAKDGFETEAFIAFAMWGIASRGAPKSPTDGLEIDQWLKQNKYINQNVLREDPDNFALLKCIWTESRKRLSPFDVVHK